MKNIKVLLLTMVCTMGLIGCGGGSSDTVIVSTPPEDAYAAGEYYYSQDNFEKAFQLFKQASDSGVASATQKLGEMYQFGWGVQKDVLTAVKCFETAAEAGNTSAMWALCSIYFLGDEEAQIAIDQAKGIA